MALTMLQRAVTAHVPFRWVTGDSVYGDDRSIRLWLETIPRGYVFAVSGKEYVWQGIKQVRISTVLQTLPDDGWTRLSAGEGTKGPRLYDWQRIAVNDPPVAGWRRWVLVRRSISDPTELTAYVCCAPAATHDQQSGDVQGAAGALVPVSVPKTRRLVWRLLWVMVPTAAFVLGWSVWRRHHQARARDYHYRRRMVKRE
jgi:SRSO17 transposase